MIKRMMVRTFEPKIQEFCMHDEPQPKNSWKKKNEKKRQIKTNKKL